MKAMRYSFAMVGVWWLVLVSILIIIYQRGMQGNNQKVTLISYF